MDVKEQDTSKEKGRNIPISVNMNSSGVYEVVTIPKVYVIGNREKSLERYGLLNYTLTHSETRHPKEAPLRKFTAYKKNFIYTGPFIQACHPTKCSKSDKDDCKQRQLNPAEIQLETSENYVSRALKGIEQADYVIAWLEGDDSYDALTELGYAHALKKKIFIACEPKVAHNYSFAFKMCDGDRLIDNRKKGLQWLFAQIIKLQEKKVETVQVKPVQVKQVQVKPEEPKKSQLICHGCIYNKESCQLRKKRINHCYRCGLQGYSTYDCIRPGCRQIRQNKKGKTDQVEAAQGEQIVCHGCIGKKYLCKLQKLGIPHCFRCGLQDFTIQSCTRCPSKKVKE